jgi:hypothetical protein
VASGTTSEKETQKNDDQDAVFRVLNRETPIAALDALVGALDPADEDWPVSSLAIAIDTNVFLRMAVHSDSEDIIDYLVTKHLAPIILPGQAIQEFWNNQLVAVDTVAKGLKKDFEKFKKSVQSIDDDFGNFSQDIEDLLDKFQNEHGHVYDAATVHKTRSLLDALRDRALVPFVNRSRFQVLADHRHRTKTPPGFEDLRNGDFFVWADFLLGLKQAHAEGSEYEHSVLITNEKKVDWIRNGVAHPVLTAEATAVGGVPFAIWSLDKLAASISAAT